jgi:hypothetical protein
MLIYLTHDISPLIKLSFNISKSIKRLDALLPYLYFLVTAAHFVSVDMINQKNGKTTLLHELGRKLTFSNNLQVDRLKTTT